MAGERSMIVHIIDKPDEGHTFDGWPLHLTVLPWIYDDSDRVLKRVDRASDALRACELTLGFKQLGPVELYGENEDVPVRAVTQRQEIDVVHGALLSLLAHQMRNLSFVGSRYNPHVTIRHNPDPGEGYSFTSDELHVVRHDGDHKTVTGVFSLKTAL